MNIHEQSLIDMAVENCEFLQMKRITHPETKIYYYNLEINGVQTGYNTPATELTHSLPFMMLQLSYLRENKPWGFHYGFDNKESEWFGIYYENVIHTVVDVIDGKIQEAVIKAFNQAIVKGSK